ncbi:MAG: prolyl oligopeptidase family serine peptidase [Planctomycetia bacterium]|nr:prolyl oligopeptidase family serine peptidase [Planctomycetia bacterium]
MQRCTKSHAVLVATPRRQVRLAAVIACSLTMVAAAWSSAAAQSPTKSLPCFEITGHRAFVIVPQKVDVNRPIPWVAYTPCLLGQNLPGAGEDWMFEKFLAAGIAVAGIDAGDTHGNPQSREIFTALYDELIKHRGFSAKPCFLARSRGGLFAFNWAAEHPDQVSCIAGIYPVCDLESYPGLEKACRDYSCSGEELAQQLEKHNPVARLAPLAKAQVPLFAIHGDSDTVVPLEKNSGAVALRYRNLGGSMQLIVPQGQGHNFWEGFFQCQELVDFVIQNAK